MGGQNEPVGGSAEWKKVTTSYWSLANDLARRMERANGITIPDLLDATYDPLLASPAKLSISHMFVRPADALAMPQAQMVEATRAHATSLH